MSLYEITFLTKEEADPGVRDLLTTLGGEISEESSLGRRRLVYPIKKESQAVYTTYVFSIDAKQLVELNRRLSLNTQLLRYLITVKPVERVDKEVSKTVREAIAAAEKLEDTPVEISTKLTETPEIAPLEITDDAAVEEPGEKKRRTKKTEPADAAEATEDDRLKALEDKLSDILKD